MDSEPVIPDPGDVSAAEAAEHARLLWLDDIKRRLHLVTSGERWIRATRRNAFRCGRWARLVCEVQFRNRPCHYVIFEDGVTDYWVIGDTDSGYEFFPPRR